MTFFWRKIRRCLSHRLGQYGVFRDKYREGFRKEIYTTILLET